MTEQEGPLETVWSVWLVVMMGANLATPLYVVYAARFGFSSFVLTAIFAAYAFVLVPTLVFFGRLSDRFGRRPVILAGLVVAAIGLAVFAAAQGTAWLFGARMLQGLAVGLISGPSTAALVAVVILRLAEPADARSERWRIQWPRVPANVRLSFARVSVAAGLTLLALGLVVLVVASPLHSLAILLVSSVVIGTGHGFSFLSAQDELNTIAPAERRGEVTSAFIGCIYLVVATSVIVSGVLDRWFALATAVGTVALTLALAATATAIWRMSAPTAGPSSR